MGGILERDIDFFSINDNFESITLIGYLIRMFTVFVKFELEINSSYQEF